MLGTQTAREIVPVLPRFHIVAMSMERLPVDRAHIVMIPIHVIHLDLVILLEEQPTIPTPSMLLLEEPG